MALPGVTTVIEDQFYALSRTEIPIGIRVLILGRRNSTNIVAASAAEVPDLDVYTATSEKSVIQIFGEGSDLHRGYLEALAGGATRVLLVPLPEDTVFDDDNGEISSDTYFASLGGSTPAANELFDTAFAAIEAARADIIVPWGMGSHPDHWQDPATPGDDPDYIGFYADNSSVLANSWAKKVADKVAEITANSHPCFAIMGVKPYIGASTSEGGMTPAQVSSHLALSNLVDKDAFTAGEDDGGETGPYLVVVASEIRPVRYNTRYSFGYANGAATMAGSITGLDSWSSPTGKSIYNVEAIRYNPTRTQQEALIAKGVVPVGINYNRAPVWVDAMTFAKENSDYSRLTTLRIVFDAVQVVRAVAQQFIGEGSTLSVRNALETAVTRGLMGMQQAGALLASDFIITYIPSENKAIVDLVLTPAFELRNIDIQVAVQL